MSYAPSGILHIIYPEFSHRVRTLGGTWSACLTKQKHPSGMGGNGEAFFIASIALALRCTSDDSKMSALSRLPSRSSIKYSGFLLAGNPVGEFPEGLEPAFDFIKIIIEINRRNPLKSRAAASAVVISIA